MAMITRDFIISCVDICCLFTLLLAFSSANALPIIELEVADGTFCVDNGTDNDGLFNNGCGGPNYAFNADNRSSEFDEFPRRMRTALEFDISTLPIGFGHAIKSAYLSLYFGNSRDLTQPGFPPPASDLLGYAGDGLASPDDMLTENLLLAFAPWPQSFINLDVTDFIRELKQSNENYAGFTFRIQNDFSPGTFSDTQFFGELSIGANNDPSKTPKLIISVAVPEPTTLVLFAVGIVGIFITSQKNRESATNTIAFV